MTDTSAVYDSPLDRLSGHGTRRHGLALLVGFWTVVGLIFVGTAYYQHLMMGTPFNGNVALWWLLGTYLWIPSTLIVLWLVRRFPIRRHSWYRVVPFHLVAAVWNSLFMASLYAALRGVEALLIGSASYHYLDTLSSVFALSLGFDCIMYQTILVAVHAFEYYHEIRRRDLEASRLRVELTEAHLQALKVQLHPHFLFNTFNTVAMLIRRHALDEAVDMIAGLGTFLRHVLDNSDEREVPLKQELNVLLHYVDIERVRFKDRLEVLADIAPNAMEAYVPNLILQPLVENAIRHGIGPGTKRGVLEIMGRREGNRLRLRVRDNGKGLPPGWSLATCTGIGLTNTKKRLERLYGEDHHLDFTDVPGGGLMVTIVIPYRTRSETELAPAPRPSASAHAPLSDA